MPNTTHCPNTGQLRRLIAGRADSAEQADLTRHLDDCSGCQRVLEAMAADGFAVPAPSERTPPPVDSAYWPALQQVRAEVDQNAVTPSSRSPSTTPTTN
jgi:hypothetical protein